MLKEYLYFLPSSSELGFCLSSPSLTESAVWRKVSRGKEVKGVDAAYPQEAHGLIKETKVRPPLPQPGTRLRGHPSSRMFQCIRRDLIFRGR